ncbi:hypothetical protein AJ80_06815 [Polytolypa hystricis UAMH7299]|uniref:DUF7905 domain-containing protein n=1 Tax=Polytolypa hystricis (strain UAMH7299) TaxID=1447883 RepID=A0A2B7XTC5_POLH7|nr:hypothetical protein AJ80_06815 [Polytolypa hystricis UAMH7299]
MEEYELGAANNWHPKEEGGHGERSVGSGPDGSHHDNNRLQCLDSRVPLSSTNTRLKPISALESRQYAAVRDKVAPQGTAQVATTTRIVSTSVPAQGVKRAAKWKGKKDATWAIVTLQSKKESESSSKEAWKAGIPCTLRVRLPTSYGQLKPRLVSSAKSINSIRSEESFFAYINRISGAFLPIPDSKDQKASIWGSPAQVDIARRIIEQFLLASELRPAKKPMAKSGKFAKTFAYSETKEAAEVLQRKHGWVLQNLREQPDPSIAFPETMLFLWPTAELPVDYSLGAGLEILDPIRLEFGYHIYPYDEIPGYIRVDGYDHDVIVTIIQRLRAKCGELMAAMHVKAKVYIVEPPEAYPIQPDVRVARVLRHSGSELTYTKPELLESVSEANESEGWNSRKAVLRSKNELRLRDAVEQSLRGLRFLRGHVKMRVNFGTMVLDEYRVAKSANGQYTFEEFREMLFHVMTKCHLVPGLQFEHKDGDLISRCFEAKDLLIPYENESGSLDEAEPFYAVNFEFEGSNASLLRLEAEFKGSQKAGVYEVSHRRWVCPRSEDKSGDKRSPLQIGVVDFERSDWQLEIKALNFDEVSNIDQSLKSFSSSIRFVLRDGDGFRGEGRRRVTFTDTVPVTRLVEKSAVRYRLKGTKYLLELARYDTYNRVKVPAPMGLPQFFSLNRMAEVPVTTWGASLFDVNWDNELGKHATFGVGQAADWSPSLNTFFPNFDKDSDPSDMRAGFGQFVGLVNRVAALLGAAKVHPSEQTGNDPSAGAGSPNMNVENEL